MPSNRRWCIVLMVAVGAVSISGGVSAGDASGPAGDPGNERPAAIVVECSPVNISWPSSSSGPGRMAGPGLSVVSTNFRPKKVPLFLDGRFVGRARDFNGKKGFLYLQPGRYRLVAALGGLDHAVFSIEARPGCRFDIKHRMVKGGQGDAGKFQAPPGKGKPVQWIYGPVGASSSPPDGVSHRRGGPDPSLRPDLGVAVPAPADRRRAMASLHLRVSPPSAEVFLDGKMLATGEEIDRMVGPLAVPAGSHTVLVRADGYTDRTVTVELEQNTTEQVDVVLEPAGR